MGGHGAHFKTRHSFLTNSTYLPRPALLFIFGPRRGIGPEEANERQGGQDTREDGELGPTGRAPLERPVSGAAAVGQHQAQRQEHQHAQQELLVGQRDEVPAFLIKIRESGKAKKGPHGSKAPPWWHRSTLSSFFLFYFFFLVGFRWSEIVPKLCSQKEHREPA